MKKFTLILIFMFAMPCTMMSVDKIDFAGQIQQLKTMLVKSNDAYICNATPMYDQALTLHWCLSYLFPLRMVEGQYMYNSEVLLEESKKLSDVITVMEQLEKSDVSYNMQVYQLIKMLVNSNDAYIHTTPMYKQSLTLEWYLQWFFPVRLIQGGHSYNSEILLTESKKLADIIVAMVRFKQCTCQNK